MCQLESSAVRRYIDKVQGAGRLVGLGWPDLYIWLSVRYWLLVREIHVTGHHITYH